MHTDTTHTPPSASSSLTASPLPFLTVCSVFAGYYSTRLYKQFKLDEWRKNTLWTALFVPGIFFVIFFILNLVIWAKQSSGAVPFGTLVALLVLWFGISLPLVYIGRFVQSRQGNCLCAAVSAVCV
jgi:transmembrane 9 superfamily member 2/4